jgi:hypothetical protein
MMSDLAGNPPMPPAPSAPPGPHHRQRRLIDAHFEGQSSLEAERTMRGHLTGCADCRAHYDRRLRLAAADPDTAVLPRDRLAAGLGLRIGPDHRRVDLRRWAIGAPLVLACLVAVVAIGLRDRRSGWQTRGRHGQTSQLLAYEVSKDGVVRQASEAIRSDSGLAFAYANIAHKGHLLVFAVDEARRVYWCHPAWNDAASDPTAVPIERDEAVHEIPQSVFHKFRGRHLEVFGAFVDSPMSVRQVEAAIARAPVDAIGRLALTLPDAELTRLELALVGDRGADR